MPYIEKNGLKRYININELRRVIYDFLKASNGGFGKSEIYSQIYQFYEIEYPNEYSQQITISNFRAMKKCIHQALIELKDEGIIKATPIEKAGGVSHPALRTKDGPKLYSIA